MSEKNEVPVLPSEVWRGMVDGIGYLGAVCMVDGDPEPRAWWWDAMWIRSSDSAAAVLGAWALSLRVSLAAALRTTDRLRHGQDIEGDDVCPNEMRAEMLGSHVEALLKERAAAIALAGGGDYVATAVKHLLYGESRGGRAGVPSGGGGPCWATS